MIKFIIMSLFAFNLFAQVEVEVEPNEVKSEVETPKELNVEVEISAYVCATEEFNDQCPFKSLVKKSVKVSTQVVGRDDAFKNVVEVKDLVYRDLNFTLWLVFYLDDKVSPRIKWNSLAIYEVTRDGDFIKENAEGGASKYGRAENFGSYYFGDRQLLRAVKSPRPENDPYAEWIIPVINLTFSK
jgi:hypothetical protein